jgi:hypothetical protein
MAKKKIRRMELTFTEFLKSLLKDPEDIDSGFLDSPPPTLEITANGEMFGKERSETRLPVGGVVFLHFSNNQMIRVRGRDISPNGVGVLINKKLKSYRVGSKFGLEFAQPHKLQGLLFKVELRRVDEDSEGNNQIGFRIVASNRFQQKRVNEYLHYIRNVDPWSV